MLPNENVSRVLKALYPLGALLMLVPIVDWTAKVYPYHPGIVQWRFGALVSVTATVMCFTLSPAGGFHPTWG